MGYSTRRIFFLIAAIAFGTLAACDPGDNSEWLLPDPERVTTWFGEGTEASISGNVLEIRGSVDPDHLRRGGRIWARSGPYFYLFNVHVHNLFEEFPDLAAVRAITRTADGQEIARATLVRAEFPEPRWREALARSSLAQSQGTENPRNIERLIQFGEDHTRFEYRDALR